MSKTDTTAVGCERVWGCLCDGLALKPCPYHAALVLCQHKLRLFGAETVDAQFPLFPNMLGEVPAKSSIVETYEQLASRTGEAVTDESGAKRFGGHSARITGARYLSRLGIDLLTIQFFARWGLNVILRYVHEAPLKALTGRTRALTVDKVVCDAVARSGNDCAEALVSDVSNKFTNVADILRGEIESLKAQITHARSHNIEAVKNVETGKIHLPGNLFDSQVVKWKTRCGWRFTKSIFSATYPTLPAGSKCPTCFKLKQVSSSSSSDDESSSS